MEETKKTLRACIKHQRKTLGIGKKLSFPNLNYPSWTSFLIMLAFFVIFFLLTHFVPFPKRLCFNFFNLADGLNYLESAHYQNLIAILAGIGAIIFALVIFIAESGRDDDTKDKTRVLLKESFLFPLTVAEILTFLLFIWGSVTSYIIIPILIIGFLTISSLSRLITILLNKNKFADKRAELLKERLRKCINEAIDERFGNNVLLTRLNENDIRLEFNIFASDKSLHSHSFKSDHIGIIADIDLEKLKRIADLIEYQANANGYSFRPRVEISPDYGIERGTESASSIKDKKTYQELRRRYLLKKYHDPVNEESNVLLSVDRELIKDHSSINKINALLKKAFVIKPIDTYTDEVKRELLGLKDQFINSIVNKQTGQIEDFTSLYIKLAETFLEAISEFGGGYSSGQATKERHAILGGWEEIRWLTEHIFEFVSNAIQSHEMLMIRKVTFLPFAIAIRAIKFGDHYLFQEYLQFADYLYFFAKEAKEHNQIQDFLYDRSWRYLKEIASYYVERQIIENDENDNLGNMEEYAIYFYVIYQGLLKKSIDDSNVKMFDVYKKATIDLFNNVKPTEARQDAEDIQWKLEKMEMSKVDREELERELKNKKRIEIIGEALKHKKYQMLFGLASWLADKVKNNGTDDIHSMYGSIQGVFVGRIEEFTNIFIGAHDFEVEDFWGWDRWDIKLDEGFSSINTQGKLELFYVVKSLSILSDISDEEINKIELPHSRDFAFLAEEGKDFNRILDDILQNPGSWQPLLSDRAIGKIEGFRHLLKKAKEAQEQEELELKRKKSISVEIIEEFKKELIKAFYEQAGMRSIFVHFKLYEDKIKENTTDDKSRFGINTVDDKAVFFKDWHIHYGGWGENYGRTMAQGENSFITDELEKDCIPVLNEDIDAVLMKIDNPENMVIIASNAINWIHKLGRRDINKQIENDFCRGSYKYEQHSLPVFMIYSHGHEEKVFIINKTKLGKLIQKSPLNRGEDRNSLRDIFFLNIKAFSEDGSLLEDFLKKPIDWLKQIGDEDLQREHLCERVLIQVYERYEFNKSKDFQGYCLKPNAR